MTRNGPWSVLIPEDTYPDEIEKITDSTLAPGEAGA